MVSEDEEADADFIVVRLVTQEIIDITNSRLSVQITRLDPNLILFYGQSIWRKYTRTETYSYPSGTISCNVAQISPRRRTPKYIWQT